MGWAPSGNHILFISDRSGTWDAWAIRVANGKAQGTARLIKQQIGPVEPLGFTRPGDCLYRVSTPNSNIYSATIDPQTHKLVGRPEKMVRRFMGRNQAPDWSPDGKQLAYVSQRGPFSPGFRSPWTLVVRTMETGVERELPLDLTNEWKWLGPNWSPDGRFLLANGRNSKRVYGLDRINVQTGDIQRITSATGTPTWSKDGQSVIYARYDEPSNSRLFLERHLETGAENELWRQTEEYGIRGIEMSPDDQELLLYSTDRLQVLPATGGEPRQLIKIEQDGIGRITGAVWSVDGQYVLFSRSNGHLWRIKASGGQTEHLGEGLDDSGLRIRLSMHPDGTRLAFHGQYGPETTDHVMALENFEAALADTSLSVDER